MVFLAATFAEWLGVQMDRKGIRSGRRLAAETGLDELLVLDWAIGRRVPTREETDTLVRFFATNSAEAHALRDKSEQALPKRRNQINAG